MRPVHLGGRGVTISPALRRHVESRVAKILRFLPKATEVRVVLARERHWHLAAVTLQAKGVTLHAEANGSDVHTGVDVALQSLEQQVRRRKDRVRERKSRAGRRSTPPTAPGRVPPLSFRSASAKPMSGAEALEQMRPALLVFTNARSRVVNVFHRLPDRALELVEPSG